MAKVHLRVSGRAAACGSGERWLSAVIITNANPDAVTCKTCRKMNEWYVRFNEGKKQCDT